jgi:two-component system cell cycle response regulator CtrA
MKIILHSAARTVEANGICVKLTRKEFALMELLTLAAHRADPYSEGKGLVTREQVFDYLYGGENIPEVKILDVFICKIRGKLRRSGLDLIQTVWGRGYRIAA